jgi:SAM-dependent methyltransferase
VTPAEGAARRDWPECPVCGGRDSESWVEFEALAFVRCRECGSVWKRFERTALRPPDFYEQDYFHGRRSGRDKRFEHRVKKAMGQLRSAMELCEARSVLDVGCSLGYVIEAGKRLGLEAAGTDLSEYAVRVCRERGHRAEVGELVRLPFRDAEFDIVFMKHVLEHTPEPMRALAEVRRVMRPGGVVVILVPDLAYWKGEHRRRSYRYFRPDDLGQQHYVYYTEESLPRLLGRAGFEVAATSKAVRRRRRPGALEPVRHAALAAGNAIARAARLRHELFVIGRVTA